MVDVVAHAAAAGARLEVIPGRMGCGPLAVRQVPHADQGKPGIGGYPLPSPGDISNTCPLAFAVALCGPNGREHPCGTADRSLWTN